jgi:ribonuclease HI
VQVSAYCDAEWGGCTATRRSTAGFVLRVFNSSISWMSKKQKTVALSSTEAEYVALSAVMAEIRWLHQLIDEMGINSSAGCTEAHEQFLYEDYIAADNNASNPIPSFSTPLCSTCITVVRSDNRSTIAQVTGEPDYHSRSKHVDIRHHFVKSMARSGKVRVEWVSTGQQMADVFTKPIDAATFAKMRSAILGEQKNEGGKMEVQPGINGLYEGENGEDSVKKKKKSETNRME